MSKGSTRRPTFVSRAEADAAWERTFGAKKEEPKRAVAIDREGDIHCPHLAWRNESYNDWGLPYYVATCVECGRSISSPNVDVYADLTSGAGGI